ncbi:hypothetical protein B0F90DRAFT_1814278 [Multifurca ochricompacta]|uniref:Uncharacterized protein n=1 Tax=Multifurca ochricompacta TaxID=376703 RepID=A0AAD4M9M4_9AGAM|nr:hypothetical protein B0F90DRAFT_1814278 [Multifurca ochricompacta]
MSSARLGRQPGRNISGGLPSTPRARSVGRYDIRDKDRDRDGDRDRYPHRRPSTATTRSVRMPRSIADMSTRAEPYSYADAPNVPPLPRSYRSDVSSQSSFSSGSASSAPGSSTFMDRMKAHSGYASSRTSTEDEPEERKEIEPERGGWLRQRTAVVPKSEQDNLGEDEEVPVQQGYGLSLWSHVATVANTLTVTVSKAWASNVTAYSGERASQFFVPVIADDISYIETPPGEESRLTRAMKAYHLEKSRDPNDLPVWLFEEHERRAVGWSSARRHDDSDENGGPNVPAPLRGRGLRDIYDAAAAAAATPTPLRQETRESSRTQQDDMSASLSSKASDRLRALRDAKRNAAQQNTSVRSAGIIDPTGDDWSAQKERGRGYVPARGHSGGMHDRAPSLPAGPRRPLAVDYRHDQVCGI